MTGERTARRSCVTGLFESPPCRRSLCTEEGKYGTRSKRGQLNNFNFLHRIKAF